MNNEKEVRLKNNIHTEADMILNGEVSRLMTEAKQGIFQHKVLEAKGTCEMGLVLKNLYKTHTYHH